MSYIVCTDSCCDLSPEYIDSHHLPVLGLMYTINNYTYEDDNFRVTTPKSFYDRIRQGDTSKTTLINADRYMNFFSTMLEKGNDVLYLGFSSGLSGSVQSALIAQDQLKDQYPDRKLIVVDPLCASMGQGLMVHYALKNQEKGLKKYSNSILARTIWSWKNIFSRNFLPND